MSDPVLNATARVQVTVEVYLSQPWSGSTPVEEVHERGARDALERLQRMIADSREIKIVGEPRVIMVTAERVK